METDGRAIRQRRLAARLRRYWRGFLNRLIVAGAFAVMLSAFAKAFGLNNQVILVLTIGAVALWLLPWRYRKGVGLQLR